MKQKTTQSVTSTLRYIHEELQKTIPNTDSGDFKVDISQSQPEPLLHKSELELPGNKITHAYEPGEISSKKYVDFFDFAPIGYLILSKEGRINEINVMGAGILGKKRPHLKNTLLSYFVADESKPVFNLFLSKIFIDDAQQACEIVLITERLVPVHVSVTGIVSSNRDQCFVTLTDITDRMPVTPIHEECENKFRQPFDEDITGNYIINEKGTLLNCNPSFLKILGYDRKEEIIGENITILHNDPSEFEFIKSQLKSHKILKDYETNRKRRNGELIYIVENKVANFNDEGEIIEIKSFMYDITDRKKAETALKLKNERLEKAIIEKAKFSSFITHLLRTPFTGFLGLSKIIAEEISTLESNEIQQMGKAMLNSATNLNKLLENLLQWSQMEQGLMPYKPELVQLLSFTGEVQATEIETAQRKGVDIVLDIPGNIFVFADAKMLRSILCNLYSNAIKFTPKGGKIKIAAKHAITNKVVFSINDSGIGISKAMQPGLFHLNTQINRKGTDGELSTGLGLFLCKYFIEKHRGAIWAESDEGKGSTFYFNLPLPKFAQSMPDFSL